MSDDLSREEIERIAAEKAERITREALQEVVRVREIDRDYGRHFTRQDAERMAERMGKQIAEETERRLVERLRSAGINLAEPEEFASLLSFIKNVRSGSASTFKIFLGALALAASTWFATVLPKIWK
jgi:hypothetical protein